MAEKKIAALSIYFNLLKHSNESNPIKKNKLQEYVENDLDIKFDRKTFADTVRKIAEQYEDLDIHDNGHKGVYVGQRLIETEELRFIADALFCSKVLPEGRAKEILQKLLDLFYEGDVKKDFAYLDHFDDVNRTKNIEILTNVGKIYEAISNRKKIKFVYKRKNLKIVKIVSPIFMLSNEGKYYIVTIENKDGENRVSNYRIDNIKDCDILDEKAESKDKMLELKGVNRSSYLKTHPHMFSGNPVQAKIKLLKSPKDTDYNIVKSYIEEWFSKPQYLSENNDIYARVNASELDLIFICLQYGSFFELVEPISVREKIKSRLESYLKTYSN